MAVAMRTDNYFELRNRRMGFYTELRSAIILACMNVDRGMAAFSDYFADRFIAPTAIIGKQNRTFDYSSVCYCLLSSCGKESCCGRLMRKIRLIKMHLQMTSEKHTNKLVRDRSFIIFSRWKLVGMIPRIMQLIKK